MMGSFPLEFDVVGSNYETRNAPFEGFVSGGEIQLSVEWSWYSRKGSAAIYTPSGELLRGVELIPGSTSPDIVSFIALMPYIHATILNLKTRNTRTDNDCRRTTCTVHLEIDQVDFDAFVVDAQETIVMCDHGNLERRTLLKGAC